MELIELLPVQLFEHSAPIQYDRLETIYQQKWKSILYIKILFLYYDYTYAKFMNFYGQEFEERWQIAFVLLTFVDHTWNF